jgi:serine/threonine protein kinase
MARVWAARPTDGHGSARLVAIKTILPKFADDAHFREMFLREGGIASRITHRNVARIFDLDEADGVLYIAMEYVDGDALSKLNRACHRKGVKIPTGVVLRVLSDVCAGLHEAHELRDGTGRLLNVVHCDVSPPNILITTKGVAKLIDFGIAKVHFGAEEETDSGTLKGKTRYMAPEQALGMQVDRRTDIWAVGATLYDLLAGVPPYKGSTHLATLQLIASGHPPAPLQPDLHPAVAALTHRSLVHPRDSRYTTAAQFHEAIENAMLKAKLTTTVADVAAFAAKHLSDRVEERRHAIEAALVSRTSSGHDQPSSRAVGTSKMRRLAWAALAALVVAVGAMTIALWTLHRPKDPALLPADSPQGSIPR